MCDKCKYNKLNTQSFIEIVRANHGDIYSFEKTNFIGTSKNVIVTCIKHNCNINILASTLLRRTERNGGKVKNRVVGSCPICREEYFIEIKNQMLDKLRTLCDNEYSFDNESYINQASPIYPICNKHGRFKTSYDWILTKREHLRCPKCVFDNKKIKTIDDKRYYECNVHGNVLIGKNRCETDGCPTCNIEKNNLEQTQMLVNRLNKQYSNNYIINSTNSEVIFTCKKHDTDISFSRNKMRKFEKKYICNKCLNEINSNKLKSYIDNTLKLIDLNYKFKYKFLEFIEGKNINLHKVKLLCILDNTEKIVKCESIINNVLSNDPNIITKDFISFEDAKAKMRELNINSFREYKKWHKRTKQTNLPSNPHRSYPEWISYIDFFGQNQKDFMSNGEQRIEKYLKRKGHEYISQKRFDDCRNINPLPFDFYLPKHNIIIEFDGEQHYDYDKAFFCSTNCYDDIQRNDKIKNQYCMDNNIGLIRIKYHELIENTIEWTLDNEISRIVVESLVFS